MHQLPDDDEDSLLPGTTAERTADLQASVAAVAERPCQLCGRRLCGHEALLAILLGARHAPRCSTCAATELGEPRQDLCERSWQWIRRRECFLAAWQAASDAEGLGGADRPSCLFAGDADAAAARIAPSASSGPASTTTPVADAAHDAGDLGCGDLVLELRFTLAAMAPGSVLEVRATDPAAPIDLPAWCGLVGHTLLQATPPRYWIRRKANR